MSLADDRVPGGSVGKRVNLGGTTTSDGSNAGLVKVDGLPTSVIYRTTAAAYDPTSDGYTLIAAVQVIDDGTGDLVLSPYSGDTDVTIANADLATTLGYGNNIFYGPFDGVTLGAGQKVLVYVS